MTCEPPNYTDNVSLEIALPFQPNKRDVKLWIDNLPIIDGKKSADMILSALHALNTLKLDPKQRFETLEQLKSQVDTLASFFDKPLVDASIPLSAEALIIAQLRIHLYRQLAIGFALTLDSTRRIFRFGRKKRFMARSIQHALFCWYQVLLYSSMSYQKADANFWAQVYKLFQIAEEFRIEKIEIDSEFSYPKRSSVIATFKQILLLFLSGPNQYRQQEIVQINTLVSLLGQRAQLINEDHNVIGTARFRINLTRHNLPEFYDELPNQPCRQHKTLEVKPVVDSLLENKIFSDGHFIAHEQLGVMPSHRVISSFIKKLNCPAKRKYTRTKLNSDSKFYVGLTSVIDALTGTPAKNDSRNHRLDDYKRTHQDIRKIDFSNYELVPLDHEVSSNSYKTSNRELRNEYYIDNLLLDIVYRSSKGVRIWDRSMERSNDDKEKIEFSATQINSSAKGYGFVSKDNSDIKIKVGEIIGIPQTSSNMEIGTIRWINTVDRNTLIFGVELISPKAEVVTVYSDNQQNPSLKGLLFPEIAACCQPTSVVLPSLSFKPGDGVKLKLSGKKKIYKLKKLFEATPSFGQFTLLTAATENII